MIKIKKHHNINVHCKKCIKKEKIEKLKNKRKTVRLIKRISLRFFVKRQANLLLN